MQIWYTQPFHLPITALQIKIIQYSSQFIQYQLWNFCRLDQVYYAQPVKGSTDHHEENQAAVLKFVTTSIDKRSIPGEQVESKAKDALDVIKRYLNDETKRV